MKSTRYRPFFVALFICCLTLLNTACGSSTPNQGVSSSPTASVHTPTATTQPVSTHPTSTTAGGSLPPVSTSCPPQGTARAAIMPTLALGNQQNIVYLMYRGGVNSSAPSILNRYDVTTGSTTEIVQVPNVRITEAQISADRQWILFIAGSKLQLIRVDGQELQTLYCTSAQVTDIISVQWSPDQKQIIFFGDGQSPGEQALYLLDLTLGTVQSELVSNDPSTLYMPRTWINNKQVYLVSEFVSSAASQPTPVSKLYILDTTKGANQHTNTLQLVAQAQSPYCGDFDSSYDTGKLFINHCIQLVALAGGAGLRQGPSSITEQSGTGGQAQTIYSNSLQAIITVRVVGYNSASLLFIIENHSDEHNIVDTSQNGLWRINTDGSGLTRLTSEHPGDHTSLNRDTQYPWSNFSHDGSMYAARLVSYQNYSATYALFFGSVSGGTPTTFATFSQAGEGFEFEVVGWTSI